MEKPLDGGFARNSLEFCMLCKSVNPEKIKPMSQGESSSKFWRILFTRLKWLDHSPSSLITTGSPAKLEVCNTPRSQMKLLGL